MGRARWEEKVNQKKEEGYLASFTGGFFMRLAASCQLPLCSVVFAAAGSSLSV